MLCPAQRRRAKYRSGSPDAARSCRGSYEQSPYSASNRSSVCVL
jgi:hypothetical protein